LPVLMNVPIDESPELAKRSIRLSAPVWMPASVIDPNAVARWKMGICG
jgi:hypothetical protein